MSNINPINFGVSGNKYFKNEEKEDLSNKSEKNVQQKKEPERTIESNEILGFMAAQKADIIPSAARKTVDVAKYVNPEQAARIEEFMSGFETDFNAISQTALEEFPDISEEAANSIALAYINSSYSI